MSDTVKKLSNSYTRGIAKSMDLNNNILTVKQIKSPTILSTWENIGEVLSSSMNRLESLTIDSSISKETSLTHKLARIRTIKKSSLAIGSTISKETSLTHKLAPLAIDSTTSKETFVLNKLTQISKKQIKD